MRTKEDIIVDLDVVSDGWDSTYPYSEVKKAMDEYAKEVAMDFAIWIGGYENLKEAKRFWHCETTEQLFKLFKEIEFFKEKNNLP